MSVEWLFIGAILGVPIGIVIAEIQYRWWMYQQSKVSWKMAKAYLFANMGMNEEKEKELKE